MTSREISGAAIKERSPFQSVMSLGRSRKSPDTRYNYSNIRHSALYQVHSIGSHILMKKPMHLYIQCIHVKKWDEEKKSVLYIRPWHVKRHARPVNLQIPEFGCVGQTCLVKGRSTV